MGQSAPVQCIECNPKRGLKLLNVTPPQARPFVWPFPKNGIPTPPSARQLKRDERDELAQLGEGLF
jgi:hypothetical protein